MQHSAKSTLRSAATKLLVAAIGLAVFGYILAHVVGDQVPPYEPSLANEVAWHTFLVSGAVAVVLGLVLAAAAIRDDRRRSRAAR